MLRYLGPYSTIILNDIRCLFLKHLINLKVIHLLIGQTVGFLIKKNVENKTKIFLLNSFLHLTHRRKKIPVGKHCVKR